VVAGWRACTRGTTMLVRLLTGIALAITIPFTALGWDGVDSESGYDIEIEGGNLVRPGEDIEVYDYGSGSYKDVEVQSINRSGSSVEVEVYDSESGEYRTFEMEDD